MWPDITTNPSKLPLAQAEEKTCVAVFLKHTVSSPSSSPTNGPVCHLLFFSVHIVQPSENKRKLAWSLELCMSPG